MADVFDTFEEQVEQRHNEMIADLESISVDNLKNEGVSLSFGGKTFKFKDLEIIEDESLEDKIRREFRDKLNNQQTKIREKINAKINQLLLMHQQKQDELTRKEQNLKNKYKNTAMMPSISRTHFRKGLSVVKGTNHGELEWLFRAEYKPKFMVIYEDGSAYSGSNKERYAIPARMVNRLQRPIVLQILTKGDQITSIRTLDAETMDDFSHYHTNCWGRWESWKNKRWNKSDDILAIMKEAQGVLETINQGSIATRAPSDMPKFATLLKEVEKYNKKQTTSINNDDEDVWEAGL